MISSASRSATSAARPCRSPRPQCAQSSSSCSAVKDSFGLKRGAFASTVAHDAHNVVVLGVDDDDMAACACRLAEIGGGIVIAEGGSVVDELPLPVAGLMSDRPLAEVYERLRSMEKRLAALGVAMAAPFMTLSFLALSVIPELKITYRGLVDVARFELVPLGIE